jgi:hypothetical protein
VGVDVQIYAAELPQHQDAPKVCLRRANLQFRIGLKDFRWTIFFDEIGPFAGIHESILVGWRHQSVEQVIQIDRDRYPIGIVGLPNYFGNIMRGASIKYWF